MHLAWPFFTAAFLVLACSNVQAADCNLVTESPDKCKISPNGVFLAKSDGSKIRIEMLPKNKYFNKFYFSLPKTAIDSFRWDHVESQDSVCTILVVNETQKIAIMNETEDGKYRSYRYPREKNALGGWIKSEKYKITKQRWKEIGDGLYRAPLIDPDNGFWLIYKDSNLVLKRCYRLECSSFEASRDNGETILIEGPNN